MAKYAVNEEGVEAMNTMANAITEAQIAFLVFIFPADYSLILRACIGVWVYLALNKCKKRLS